MPRSSHGTSFTFDDFRGARDAVVDRSVETRLGFAVAARRVVTEDFGFLFPELQNSPENLLPEARATRDNLIELGNPCETQETVWVEETPVSRRPTLTSGSSSTTTLR